MDPVLSAKRIQIIAFAMQGVTMVHAYIMPQMGAVRKRPGRGFLTAPAPT